MTNKYNAQKTQVDGHTFDSRAEAERYLELKSKTQSGDIDLLEIHPRFELIPGYKINGKRIRPTYYYADFQYWDNHAGRIVVEDVKGVETAVFRLKMKLLMFQNPQLDFRIIEV